MTRTGIRRVNNKFGAILNIIIPTTKRQVQAFIGLINFYRYMWDRRSNLIQPLTALTLAKVEFKWISAKQKSFGYIKCIVMSNTLSEYPDLNEQFGIHADASEYQIGEVINQYVKPITFYSRKLTGPKIWYTVTEK